MISCPQYDYVEIACMYKIPLQIVMRDGTVLTGIALDTKINSRQEECLILKTDSSEEVVVLSSIKELQTMIQNPHFDRMEFE